MAWNDHSCLKLRQGMHSLPSDQKPAPETPIPTQLIAVAFTLPFQVVTMDFIPDLPKSDGYNSIAEMVFLRNVRALQTVWPQVPPRRIRLR